ncbi:MAG: hypothetical protein Q7T01_01360 [bacterium]|nr:hypothetical protein [bacterium]
MFVVALFLGVAGLASSAYAQWQEPGQAPPSGNPPGFVWLQGGAGTPETQTGNIVISGALQAANVLASGNIILQGSEGSGYLYGENERFIMRGSSDFSVQNAAGDAYVSSANGFLYAYGQAGKGVLVGPALYVQGGSIVAMPASSSAPPADLTLSTVSGTSAAVRMHVSGVTGNVGIGATPDASRKLWVAGDIATTGQLCLQGDCRGAWPAAGATGDFVSLTDLVIAPAGQTSTSGSDLWIAGTARAGKVEIAGNGTQANLDVTAGNFYVDASGNIQFKVNATNANPGSALTVATSDGTSTLRLRDDKSAQLGFVHASTLNVTAPLVMSSTANAEVQIDADGNDVGASWFRVLGQHNSYTPLQADPILEVSEEGELKLSNALGTINRLHVGGGALGVGIGGAAPSGVKLRVYGDERIDDRLGIGGFLGTDTAKLHVYGNTTIDGNLSIGLTIIESSFSVPANAVTASGVVTCAAGQRIGGGCKDDGSGAMQLLHSYPVTTGQSWGCGYRNGTAFNRTATSYAICARLAP